MLRITANVENYKDLETDRLFEDCIHAVKEMGFSFQEVREKNSVNFLYLTEEGTPQNTQKCAVLSTGDIITGKLLIQMCLENFDKKEDTLLYIFKEAFTYALKQQDLTTNVDFLYKRIVQGNVVKRTEMVEINDFEISEIPNSLQNGFFW